MRAKRRTAACQGAGVCAIMAAQHSLESPAIDGRQTGSRTLPLTAPASAARFLHDMLGRDKDGACSD